jgi:hypothetical protein
VLVSARSRAEIAENVEMFSYPIPGALWEELRAVDALPADAPIPGGHP